MPTAFVTGGTGFVGIHLVNELISLGWRVTALHRVTSDLSHLEKSGVNLVPGSITDLSSLEKAMPDSVDVVFHVAGDTGMWFRTNARQYQVNVEGTRNMVECALRKGASRFIHTSSIAAFGYHDERITEETSSTALEAPLNYFRTKFLAEQEVDKGISRGLDALFINPANIIGPYDYSNWSQSFLLIQKQKLPGIPNGEGSFCHVASVAAAHIAAVERGRTGHRYLMGGVDATFRDLFTHIGKLLHKTVPQRSIPTWLMLGLGYASNALSLLTGKEPDITPEKVTIVTRRQICTSEKAMAELGYEPVTLERMLEDCYRWMCDEHMI